MKIIWNGIRCQYPLEKCTCPKRITDEEKC